MFILTMIAFSCSTTEEKEIVEFYFVYDTQDNIWRIDNSDWTYNNDLNNYLQCASNQICAKSVGNCSYLFSSQMYQFIEVYPINFQPQITINQNEFTVQPLCSYFDDTDLLKFKIKAQIP